MQTDRTNLMAFMRLIRSHQEPASAAAIASVSPAPSAQCLSLVAQPMQTDRTSLRAAMDRIAISRKL